MSLTLKLRFRTRKTELETDRIVQQKNNQLRDEQTEFDTLLEEKRCRLIEITSDNLRAEADSKAYELSAVMNVFQNINPNILQSLAAVGMKPDKIIAMAFQELAENAGNIGQLNISPDLLQTLMREQR